ncbi:unnamed protein product [Phytophthora lilii]|uniref:Unnamed protein product n=1 Tax=Phytophthora lilii TaxID=2077276 RepID=A0A9W6TR56_9STRA|nr:unnamed protein product [Phytophthora lilii]
MSRSTKKDYKERYLTTITVRAADKVKEIEEEVVTKKMPKFIDGGPQDFLEWVYAFEQLAKLKHWNAEDKFLNATILLEGDLRDAFEDAAFSDEDVRMDEEFVRALRMASIVVLPVDYNEKLQKKKICGLYENSPKCEDALCRLYKRGLPYDWQNKYDATGQVYTTIAALVAFFERIEQGKERQRRGVNHGGHDNRSNNHDNSCSQGRRGNSSNRRNNFSGSRQQNRGGGRGRGSINNNSSINSASNMYCTFHRTSTHHIQDCRALRHDHQPEEHQQLDQKRGRNNSSGGQGPGGRRHGQTRVEQRRQRKTAPATKNTCSWELMDNPTLLHHQ